MVALNEQLGLVVLVEQEPVTGLRLRRDLDDFAISHTALNDVA